MKLAPYVVVHPPVKCGGLITMAKSKPQRTKINRKDSKGKEQLKERIDGMKMKWGGGVST